MIVIQYINRNAFTLENNKIYVHLGPKVMRWVERMLDYQQTSHEFHHALPEDTTIAYI